MDVSESLRNTPGYIGEEILSVLAVVEMLGKFTKISGKCQRKNLVRETIYCLHSCLGQYQCLVVEYFSRLFVDDEIK